MIKIAVHILDGELAIEIKQNGDHYEVLVVLSKSAYFKENGRIWHKKVVPENSLQELIHLLQKAYSAPSNPGSLTINDGCTITVNLKEDESEITFAMKNFEDGTIELQVMKKLYGYLNEIFQDAILMKYTTIFAGNNL